MSIPRVSHPPLGRGGNVLTRTHRICGRPAAATLTATVLVLAQVGGSGAPNVATSVVAGVLMWVGRSWFRLSQGQRPLSGPTSDTHLRASFPGGPASSRSEERVPLCAQWQVPWGGCRQQNHAIYKLSNGLLDHKVESQAVTKSARTRFNKVRREGDHIPQKLVKGLSTPPALLS